MGMSVIRVERDAALPLLGAGPRPPVCGCCHVRPAAAAHGRRRVSPPGERGAGLRSGHQPESEAAANTDVRGYSPSPPLVSPIRGLIDFHTHAAPDVFGRAVDDDELAAMAAAREMEAVVFKNHVALTADRAWLVGKRVGGVKVYGGVVLNSAVGGINPQGERHFVLGTDVGQTGNPTPPAGLQMFVAGLAAQGITRDQIQAMGREVPGALLTG